MNVIYDLKQIAYGNKPLPKGVNEVAVRATALRILALIGLERKKEKAKYN